VNKLDQLVGKAKFLGLQSEVESKWSAVKDKVYSLSEREKQLGLGEKVCSPNSAWKCCIMYCIYFPYYNVRNLYVSKFRE